MSKLSSNNSNTYHLHSTCHPSDYGSHNDCTLLIYCFRYLSAIVTDNASNMMGETEGFSSYLKRDLERPDIISHGCLAHKLELVLNAALKNAEICTNCNRLNFYLKKVHSFFRKSNKRKISFGKYCQALKRPCFRARRIMEVRWVASHFMAARVIFLNWDILVGFLKSLESDPNFDANSESKENMIL